MSPRPELSVLHIHSRKIISDGIPLMYSLQAFALRQRDNESSLTSSCIAFSLLLRKSRNSRNIRHIANNFSVYPNTADKISPLSSFVKIFALSASFLASFLCVLRGQHREGVMPSLKKTSLTSCIGIFLSTDVERTAFSLSGLRAQYCCTVQFPRGEK